MTSRCFEGVARAYTADEMEALPVGFELWVDREDAWVGRTVTVGMGAVVVSRDGDTFIASVVDAAPAEPSVCVVLR